jgi:hypothetical protein
MAPTTVTPPPETCAKCGWPLNYVPNHVRYLCNPVGGKAVDELAAKLEGFARVTKTGYGQDTATVVFEGGSSVVMFVSKEGRFSVDGKNLNLVGDHGLAGTAAICRLFAQITQVTDDV